jgi:Skp family chaperone for outer membrane proteins
MNNKPLSILILLACFTVGGAAQTPTPGPGAARPPAASGGAVPNAKVAIVFISAFREGIDQLKQKYQKLSAEFEPRARELETMQNSLSAKEKVLAENKGMTPQQYRKLADEFEQLKREFERKRDDSQTLARKREEEETGATYEEILKSLAAYSQQRGITVVLEGEVAQRNNIVVYALPSLDITKEFIAEYNKAHPAAAAKPAPATPKPAPSTPNP